MQLPWDPLIIGCMTWRAKANAANVSVLVIDPCPHGKQVFDHVIEYLRTVRFSDAELPLPRGRADLALLLREANFYGLPGLSAKARR